LPFVEHAGAFRSTQTPRGSSLPFAIGVHRPGADASAQLLQAPVQSESQHSPSTQWFEAHSAAVAQARPRSFGPHLLLTQACPASQSAFVVQEVVHWPAAQRKGAHVWTPGGLHVPRPSHVPGVLRFVPVHEDGMQVVSAAYFAQLPNPSHLPVVPQVAAVASLHTPRGSARPMSVGQQVPRRSGSAHETQPPPHATLQHTPSAQNFEAHSVLFAQFAPFILRPQLLATHAWPATHCPFCVQDSKQVFFVVSQL
jgi:hypothetical protein